LLGGVIDCHLQLWEDRKPDTVAEIKKSLYVDDLISGSTTIEKAKELRDGAIEIFEDAKFTLHKWNSNEVEVQPKAVETQSDESTYAKQQLGARASESKILGLPWDKAKDTLKIIYPQEHDKVTKRSILATLAKIYDPIGVVSPTTLAGKLIYRNVCDLKIPWDASVPSELSHKWEKWHDGLPDSEQFVRSIIQHQESIESIELHGFGDASGNGVAAAVYAVASQRSGTSQGLVTAKARLAKRNTTIPRLELTSAHMATNLLTNVKNALTGFPISGLHVWLDSTVALYWIQNGGDFKQFVANRVSKIQQHDEIIWHHVPTTDNPADLGSRGGSVIDHILWWKGPKWLSHRQEWPPEIVTRASPETKAETKMTKEILHAAVERATDVFDDLLGKYKLWKVLRVGAWINRFILNCKAKRRDRDFGPLRASEIKIVKKWWIKRVQDDGKAHPNFANESLELNLQENNEQVLECRGRIQGSYPIYLPDNHTFTEKLVEDSHLQTLHGGVPLTMTHVRSVYWIPRLRRLAKRIRKSCFGCKRAQAKAYSVPPPGILPTTRTQGENAFEVIGVDFAGPIKYRTPRKTFKKSYVILYTCSLTRGIYLELLPSLEADEFLRSFKTYVARRGRPRLVYSDNGGTFIAAASWIKRVMKDEKVSGHMARQEIEWRFNLSRAPWWGGQFERLVGLVKAAMYKVIGGGNLSWKELQDVLLDVEVSLNNRPLDYVEDDVQRPILTPNSLLLGQPNIIPQLEPYNVENVDLRKRAKYLQTCKDTVWRRWTKEYLRALRERHKLKHGTNLVGPNVGDVVIIKNDERNRGKWQLGIVTQLLTGKDGIVRGAKVRAGKGTLERAVQQLYPLELSCGRTGEQRPNLRPEAPEFRPKRNAAAIARLKIQDEAEDNELD
jgi:hypothetical protein